MSALPLTPEQEAEAQALFARLKSAFEQEAWQMAGVLASKEDRQWLGGTEFEVRERGHRLGAQVVESVLQERKKRLPRGEDWLSTRPGVGPVGERAEQGGGKVAGASAG